MRIALLLSRLLSSRRACGGSLSCECFVRHEPLLLLRVIEFAGGNGLSSRLSDGRVQRRKEILSHFAPTGDQRWSMISESRRSDTTSAGLPVLEAHAQVAQLAASNIKIPTNNPVHAEASVCLIHASRDDTGIDCIDDHILQSTNRRLLEDR